MLKLRNFFQAALVGLSAIMPCALWSLTPDLLSLTNPPPATLSDQQNQMLKQLTHLELLLQEFMLSDEWKAKERSNSLNDLFRITRHDLFVQPPTSVKEFRHRLMRMFNSLTDWHTGLSFYATESAVLPFTIREAEGRYFVYTTDHLFFKMLEIPALLPGDEILTWNGKAIGLAVQALCDELFPTQQPAYAWRHAAHHLTGRFANYGHSIPLEEEVTVTVRFRSSQEVAQFSIPWITYQEEIQPRSFGGFGGSAAPQADSFAALLEQGYQLSSPFHAQFDRRQQLLKKFTNKISNKLKDTVKDKLKHTINHIRDSLPELSRREEQPNYDDPDTDDESAWYALAAHHPLPPLGELLWESNSNDLFYCHLTSHSSGKHVAYIRLPSFAYGPAEVLSDYAAQFADLIREFEENSDLLIIDQRMNGGGSLLFMYGILQTLITKPLKTPRFIERLCHSEIASAWNLLDSLYSKPPTDKDEEPQEPVLSGYWFDANFQEQATGYYKALIRTWEQGKILTDPVAYLGVTHLQPHPQARYSKPILLLIDECSISCGDLFPALLQDEGRAILIGSKTAGAGGHVAFTSFTNPWGIAGCSYAASLILRADGSLIDRVGVSPDLPYTVTADDLEFNLRDYAAFLNRVIEAL